MSVLLYRKTENLNLDMLQRSKISNAAFSIFKTFKEKSLTLTWRITYSVHTECLPMFLVSGNIFSGSSDVLFKIGDPLPQWFPS